MTREETLLRLYADPFCDRKLTPEQEKHLYKIASRDGDYEAWYQERVYLNGARARELKVPYYGTRLVKSFYNEAMSRTVVMFHSWDDLFFFKKVLRVCYGVDPAVGLIIPVLLVPVPDLSNLPPYRELLPPEKKVRKRDRVDYDLNPHLKPAREFGSHDEMMDALQKHYDMLPDVAASIEAEKRKSRLTLKDAAEALPGCLFFIALAVGSFIFFTKILPNIF